MRVADAVAGHLLQLQAESIGLPPQEGKGLSAAQRVREIAPAPPPLQQLLHRGQERGDEIGIEGHVGAEYKIDVTTGCGLCQTKVPCSMRIPKRPAKKEG